MVRLLVALSALVAVTFAATVDLDADAKAMFVDLHNQYRRATGASMEDLIWDDQLADVAAGYSGKCEFAHPSDNDYGENIYLGWGPSFSSGAAEAKKAVDKWHSEIDNVDPDWECIANVPEATCGHYSQEVWAKSKKLGCAITTDCEINGHKWALVFCEYSPAGNMMKGYDWDNKKYIVNPPY